MKRLLTVALILTCTGCAQRLTAPVDVSPLESYDWAHHTETEFWETYPELQAQYDVDVTHLTTK